MVTMETIYLILKLTSFGLFHSLLAQVGIIPATELVLHVPLGLSVPDHHNLVGGHG